MNDLVQTLIVSFVLVGCSLFIIVKALGYVKKGKRQKKFCCPDGRTDRPREKSNSLLCGDCEAVCPLKINRSSQPGNHNGENGWRRDEA